MTPRIWSLAPVLALAAGVAACATDDGGEAACDMRDSMEKPGGGRRGGGARDGA